MASLPIMIDGDSGVDDAIALLLALAPSELDALGITTVARNIRMHQIQHNVMNEVDAYGSDTESASYRNGMVL